jgi:hypothetical protein
MAASAPSPAPVDWPSLALIALILVLIGLSVWTVYDCWWASHRPLDLCLGALFQ